MFRLLHDGRGHMSAAAVLLLILSAIAAPRPAQAAEGAISFYVPGLYGDFGVALTPEPGVYILNTGTYYTARADYPLLPIPAQQSFEGWAYINLVRGFYVFDKEVLGGRYAVGVRVPHLAVALDVTLTSPLGSTTFDADTEGRGDFGLVPLSIYWNWGKLYANLYQTVTLRSGEYRATSFPNAGRNHWSFDTVLALSWIDLAKGIEIAAVPGIIVNTENPATHYRSGTEFHLDYMVNKLLAPTVGVGLHGSFYRQITDDSGAGALLGGFRGRAMSIGPALLWRPKIAGHQSYFALKWLHEFNVENRFEGELVTFTGGLKF